ncbi:MAG: DUF4262 domain-containing protein [Ilumatobacteraceae bacterium]
MSNELPDFHIPHAEKIEWMIEDAGWALEPVQPNPESDPPLPGYAYTIGLPALTGFAEIAVFGLTPVAARGLIGLVVDMLQGGTEIPYGVELVGLFDNDLRSVFAPIDIDTYGPFFRTAVSWYRGAPFEMVQLLWPDRNGFLPTEAGYAQHMRLAQPVIATV